MAYRKRAQKRRVYRKRTAGNSTAKIQQIVKRQLNKVVETKMSSFGAENQQLYHNVPYQLISNGFNTAQGVTDPTQNPSANRIGDSLLVKALNIKIWLANKADRPNQIYRVTLLLRRINSGGVPVGSPFTLITGVGNNLLAFPNHEANVTKVLYDKMHTFNMDTDQSSGGSTKEVHKYVQIYKTFNTQVTYLSGGSIPKNYTPQLFITAYDSYGTLTSDNISSAAYAARLYFQDA